MRQTPNMLDLKCDEWTPLTREELKYLEPVGLMPGKALIDRILLARLLGERDRLQCVLQSSLWVIEEMIKSGMIEKVHVKLEDPTDIERAIYMLRCSIQGCYPSPEETDVA
tara:strand:- start:408 stop:740 length:333 start_codon:yes stop_codon:yes gene_type:complete